MNMSSDGGDQGGNVGQGGNSVLNGDAGASAASSPNGPAGAGGAGGDAGAPAHWAEGFLSPENIEALKAKNFDSGDAFATAYLNLEKTVGGNAVLLPGEDATAEDWSKFYDQVGRPKDPGEYKFSMPEGVEASDSDKAFQSAIAPVLHEADLTQRQVGIINAGWNKINADAAEAYNTLLDQQYNDAMAELKKQHGSAFDDKLAAGNAMVRQLGGEEFADYLAESGLGRDPRFLNALMVMGEMGAGDGALIGSDLVPGISSPGAAKAEIAKLEADEDFGKAFLDKSHPGHGEAVKKMQALQQLARKEG